MESLPATVSFTPHLARARLKELDTRITELESHNREITWPENTIHDLRQERQALQTRLDTYVYPILNLPDEITSEIFVQSLDPDASPLSPSSPLFLGHVCHAWREIALSTPCLWATIDLFSTTAEANERCLRLLPLWLARSRQYPLHISIIHKPHAPSLRKFFDAILPHSKRWHGLDVWMSFDDIIFLCTSLELPLLRRLKIGMTGLQNVPYSMGSFPTFRNAPNLRSLTTSCGTALFRFPWAQLTSLTLPVVFLHTFWETLSATTKVEYLAIHVILGMDDKDAELLPKIPPLLHLHSLEILAPPGFEPNPKGHVQLLNQLTLPALRGFQFPEASFPATSIPAIRSLITRSGFPVNCLDIIIEDAQHSIEYYRARFPDVNALVVNGVDAFYGENEDVEDSDSDSDPDSGTDTDTESDDRSSDDGDSENNE
ncbi:WD40 repeat-like protein [Mycena venus]|uniref:WD40 repeat-like protein n=1 Tax=Mycena venus TaxID=2733690 RepID=A0A8H6Z0W0_9AGAR|nr:WD40 repeat-like protein [Mycena venus]